MSEPVAAIRQIECINPILNVANISVSLDFYVDILGFKNADWGNEDFTCISKGSGSIYLCRGEQGLSGAWVWVGFDGDMKALYKDLKAKCVAIKLPPTNYPWALEMHIEDPDGHILRLGTDPENSE